MNISSIKSIKRLPHDIVVFLFGWIQTNVIITPFLRHHEPQIADEFGGKGWPIKYTSYEFWQSSTSFIGSIIKKSNPGSP